MVLLHLAKASLAKKKGMAATLLFLSALSTLFLNLGLTMSGQMQDACTASIERLQGPDFFAASDATKYDAAFEAFLREDARIQWMEKEDIIYLEITKNNHNSSRAGAIIFNMDNARQIEPVTLLRQDPSIPDSEAIYLPEVMEAEGIATGSEYILTYKNTDYAYRVAGFFETSCMGTTGYTFMKYYMPREAFTLLYETAGAGKALSARLADGMDKAAVSRELKKDFLKATDYYNKVGNLYGGAACISYDGMLDNMLSLISIPMMLMISIAFVICTISFITVFFKVKEEIGDSLPEIGSLQAMGYTTRQIILSKTAEFSLVGAAGGVLGILVSCAALPAVTNYGEGMIGIRLRYTPTPGGSLLSLLIILLLITLAAVTASWRIRKLSPVAALRKGLQTSCYGRNFFPLEKGRSGVVFRLALKNITADYRRNTATITAIAMGTFAVSLSAVLYANFGYDTSAVAKMTGIEVANVQVTPLPHTDILSLQAQLEQMPGVRKTNLSAIYMAAIEEEDIFWVITGDFSKTEQLTLTEGSFPQYDNEVTLSSGLLHKLGKEVGDTVSVTLDGITKDYLITGIFIGTNNNGKEGLMSLEGMKRLDPYFSLSNIDIYLEEDSMRQDFIDMLYPAYGVSSADTPPSAVNDAVSPENEGADYTAAKRRAEEKIKEMLDQYGVSDAAYAVMLRGDLILTGSSDGIKIKEVSSMQEYLDGQLASYAATMTGMMAMILTVMLLVMGAIVSITVSALIRRQKTSFGIYKALGYTTRDLIRIVRLNMAVNAAAGSLTGILLCRLFANSLLHLLFQNMGLDLARFHINPFLLAASALFTFLFVWLLSSRKARRVKGISVYDLLTE